MREHIDTIPVWDSYRAGGECPLCTLHGDLEERYLDYALGDSLMEPAIRIETNEKGFCQRHDAMMLTRGNRLGLGLMTHTHLLEVVARMEAIQNGAPGGKKKWTESSKRSERAERMREIAGDVERHAATCMICDRIDTAMARYVYTVVYLLEKDADFERTFRESRGLCMRHFAQVLRSAADEFSDKVQQKVLEILLPLQLENLKRVTREVEWFTLKFDYRNADKSWGTSRDSIERALLKLQSVRPDAKKGEKAGAKGMAGAAGAGTAGETGAKGAETTGTKKITGKDAEGNADKG